MAGQDISSVIKKQIEGFESETSLIDVGVVVAAGDGIAQIHGLSNVKLINSIEIITGIDQKYKTSTPAFPNDL